MDAESGALSDSSDGMAYPAWNRYDALTPDFSGAYAIRGNKRMDPHPK